MRLIDADKINPMRCPRSIEEMRKWIDEQPTVDAVEVVRCKDCKYGDRAGMSFYVRCKFIHKAMNTTDFCSYGERREK